MPPTASNPGSTPAFMQTAEEALAALGTDPVAGLTSEVARERLAQHGRNELTAQAAVPGWKKFLAQFKDLLVLLLLVATAISLGLWIHERDSALPYEAMVIVAVVLLNAILGFAQEAKAEKSVAALRKLSAAQATVIRDGKPESIDGAEVVPGDLLQLEEGDSVAADARLVHVAALQTAEASLTGESLPAAKDVAPLATDAGLGDRTNMVFSGTAVTSGRGRAVVIATGMQTQMGEIAGALHAAPTQVTPLQHELTRVGRLLGLIVVIIAVVMVLTIVLVEEVRGASAVFDVMILGVALAVAAVPEGLPAVVTAVLSMGVQRMAKRNAIVRQLAAVETLGSASVIASDKTGTLTRNEMTVRTVVTASGRVVFSGTGYAPEGEVTRAGGGALDGALREELGRALAIADLASNASVQEHDGQWSVEGDPTEGGLIVAARKAGLKRDDLGERFERVGEVPFSSERKLMSTVHIDTEADGIKVFTKGAPDVLLGRCGYERIGSEQRPLTEARRAELIAINEGLAKEALRTLGVASRKLPAGAIDPAAADAHIEADLVFCGLIGMIDPPREEAKEAVARAKRAGIRPVMITGDHPATASVIARELGISDDGRVASGAELTKLSDGELAALVREVAVYARVNPEHKLRIVKALQAEGAIVAMTGDGVNDAPALKTADIGVAMGITGTDVSKEASDIVLADDNFASIVAAVEEGRAIFANIRKFLRYLLASNIGEVLTMFFGVLLVDVIGLRGAGPGPVVLPLLATQLLWINLVSDGAPALALGVDPPSPGVMEAPPRPRGESVITLRMWLGIVQVGLVTAVGTLGVLDASLPRGLLEGTGSLRYAQTMAFTTLVLASLFTVFTARSDTRSAFSKPFSNPWLWLAVGASLGLQAAVVYVPFLQSAFGTAALAGLDWLLCAAVASAVLWVRELTKLVTRSLHRSPTQAAAGPSRTHAAA